jgi:hypothetical protein
MKFRSVLIILAALAVTLPAAATSYVMVSDQNLVDSAAAVVDARVLSVDEAPKAGMPATDYMIEVDHLVAGEAPGRNLIVRVPGGERPDGTGLRLYGMPEFVLGERVLLFLNPRQDGTYGIVHLMLGAFRQTVLDGRAVLVRDLTGARELAMPGEAPGSRDLYHQPRDAEAFRRWVAAEARGAQPEPDYFLALGPASQEVQNRLSEKYRLFTGSRGSYIRWFAFDSAQNVDWRVLTGGQPGYGQSRTLSAANRAVGAWNSVSQTNIRYRVVGTTGATVAFNGCGADDCTDGINSIVFDDVDNSINDAFTCSPGGGGTLAIGGPWYSNRTFPGPNNQSYHQIAEGEIVLNKGIDCFLFSDADLEQLLAHELGHTLGLDHPCGGADDCPALQSDALMRAYFHTDGRGAQMNSDDRAAVRFLYPGSTGTPPAAPTNLIVVDATPDSVELAWTDNSTDEDFFLVQGALGEGAFESVGTSGANVPVATITGLTPNTDYRFRVQARGAGGGSAYSNIVEVSTQADVPATPASVTAAAQSGSQVELTWNDLADNETSFRIEMRSPSTAGWNTVLAAIPANSESAVVDGLAAGTPYAFRVLAVNAKGESEPSAEVAATTPAGLLAPCTPSAETVCLLGGRFAVSVSWRNQFLADDFGTGKGELFDGSDRTASFWFFNPNNTELIVKVLNGTGLNGNYWTFHGALTNVEYWITVVDTDNGNSHTYYNPPGDECGLFDTASLPAVVGASTASSVRAAEPQVQLPAAPAAQSVDAKAGACVPAADTLCLMDGRFAVKVDWVNQHDNNAAGIGTAVEGSDQTGYFWYFNPANIELVVKVLDGRNLNGNFWFFYGSLSDVQYEITVTDTETGESVPYLNSAGDTCGEFDTGAFTPDVGTSSGLSFEN